VRRCCRRPGGAAGDRRRRRGPGERVRARARAAAGGAAPQDTFGALAVAGTGGGLTDELRPGDLVVATGVTDGTTTTACPSAPLLAGSCAGPGWRSGPAGGERGAAGRWPGAGAGRGRGALAVDLESAWLAAAAVSGRWR